MGNSIAVNVSFSLMNSTFTEGGTSFLNVASDSTIPSMSTLIALTIEGDAGGDGGTGGASRAGGDGGAIGDSANCGDADMCGDVGMGGDDVDCGDGDAGGDGDDCVLFLPFWAILPGGTCGRSAWSFTDRVSYLVIGCWFLETWARPEARSDNDGLRLLATFFTRQLIVMDEIGSATRVGIDGAPSEWP